MIRLEFSLIAKDNTTYRDIVVFDGLVLPRFPSCN